MTRRRRSLPRRRGVTLLEVVLAMSLLVSFPNIASVRGLMAGG